MIKGLFEESDLEVIMKMDFDEAVPLLVVWKGISEDEAFEMWKAHQRIDPIADLLWLLRQVIQGLDGPGD